MAGPTREFWQNRFETRQTPWDRGEVSPQLRAWLEAGVLRPSRICVPGSGSGWEVAALARRGFDVTALDYAPAAIERARALLAQEGLTARLEQADVLQWRPDAPFEAIYEQTCLCALHPDYWAPYAAQLHSWLVPGGTLWALFMQVQRPGAAEGQIEGPPYHCDINAMRALFPAERWAWPKPPYPIVPHPMGMTELAVPLVRR
jgi:hypothetical protein